MTDENRWEVSSMKLDWSKLTPREASAVAWVKANCGEAEFDYATSGIVGIIAGLRRDGVSDAEIDQRFGGSAHDLRYSKAESGEECYHAARATVRLALEALAAGEDD
jgi:hypothetical protein